MTHRNTWKNFERVVAKDFGASGRTPLSGGNSGHTRSDTLHPRLFIECKLRARFAPCRTYDEAAELADKEDKVPLVALKEKGRAGYYLILRPEDLPRICDEWQAAQEVTA